MLLGRPRITIYGFTALMGAGALMCLAAGGKPVDPDHRATAARAVDRLRLHPSSPIRPSRPRRRRMPTASPSCAISRRRPAPRACPRPTRGSRSISTRAPSPARSSSKSCTPSTTRSPPSRPISTSTTRASSSIPRPRNARPAVRPAVRAAQPAARAHALVSHAGGIPRRIAPARQAAQRPPRRHRPRPHRRPLGADGRAEHPLPRQRAGAGRRPQPDHRPHPQGRN